ncbi:MAG: riboflavin synthase [Candidatus Omnitrophica bacterium]|nr:riboflavin synthase [Candidatus Omnitrophota bacterium]
MFTGIVEKRGKVIEICKKGNCHTLKVSADELRGDICIGESISVNGVCLTVTKTDKGNLSFDVMGQTMNETTLRNLSKGNEVNLERALKVGDRMGGHFVTGHIDCLGKIVRCQETKDGLKIDIMIPSQLRKFIIKRGSVALDGVSLTVAEKSLDSFTVFIIPHTASLTGIGAKRSGSEINVELDMLGKYALGERSTESHSAITASFLKEHGFG